MNQRYFKLVEVSKDYCHFDQPYIVVSDRTVIPNNVAWMDFAVHIQEGSAHVFHLRKLIEQNKVLNKVLNQEKI